MKKFILLSIAFVFLTLSYSQDKFRNGLDAYKDVRILYGGILKAYNGAQITGNLTVSKNIDCDTLTADYFIATDTSIHVDSIYADDVTVNNILYPKYIQQGTIATPRSVTITSSNYVPNQINIVSVANPSEAVTLMGLYSKVANSTAHQANLQLVGIGSRVTMGKNATDAYGLQSHLTLNSGAASTGNMTAISGKTILHGDNAAGIVTAGLFTIEGHQTPTTGYGVWIDNDSAHITAGLEIHSTHSGSLTSGIMLSTSNSGTITNDITLQNSETINNSTDGVINMGAAFVRSATYNFADATAVGGTGDAITINFSPDLPTLVTGCRITFIAEAANTTATTLTIDGGTTKAVEEYNGAQSALDANDIRSGQVVELVYNGTAWVMVSPSGN